MSGQTKYCSEIQKEIDEYVQKVDLYNSKKADIVFDLRAYSKFLKKKHSNGLNLTPKDIEQFILKR